MALMTTSGSVLQSWVMQLPLREQGTLLTAVRGCDLAPRPRDAEGWPLETPERQLAAFIRWAFMVPADAREVDVAGAWFRSRPPDHFRLSEVAHYPMHWISHVIHALEVIGYRHPDQVVATQAGRLYRRCVQDLHLTSETKGAMIERLSEDRITLGEIVS